jgi:uncharacterized protein YcbX
VARDVGRVAAIWRYPVKSIGGEQVESALITAGGIEGDRGWALYDEDAGQIRNAKLLPKLMMFRAAYQHEPGGHPSPPVTISGPDGQQFTSDRLDEASAGLTAALGRKLRLSALEPASNTAHYRKGKPDIEDPVARTRASFALDEGEPMPDASRMASLPGMADLREYAAPLGTYFDVAPLHLVTTAAQAELQRLNPAADADVRRFRPNLVIDCDDPGFPELDWVGKVLLVGNALLEIRARTLRCAMPTHAQPGLERATSIMRTLVRETMQDFGVYALVTMPDTVRVGDAVMLAG